MILLPNGCSCSNPSVFPKNWKTVSASTKKDWRIQYYFRDPKLKKEWPDGKLIVVKGMNRFKAPDERKAITQSLLEDEVAQLQNGYNPILRELVPVADRKEISPETPFIAALRFVHKKLHCVHSTFLDIKSTIKFVEEAAQELKLDMTAVGKIKRKHIRQILDQCAESKENWSDNTFNAYRKNLGILFKELVELEAAETNVIRDISKRKTVRKIKRILTPEECKKVSDWVKNFDRRFWLLIHIFFHSGCRTTEIFRVKKKHVDLDKQMLLITVLKGNQPFEVLKPIKNIAIDFWKEAIEGAGDEDFIFAKGLTPGRLSISPRQATRRWKRHIKGSKKNGKLGIICDWYSLKYLNSDQVSKERGLKVASLLNSHTNTNTTLLYAVNENERMNEELKNVANEFG